MIDAHHHIWRQADLPWLMGPEQPRIFGPYGAIRRDYLIDEFRADLAGTGITKSVYVQANWAPARAEDEVAWVQSVANETGWPHAIIGFADFTVDDIRPFLKRMARYARLRGFRQQFHWHANPLYRFAPDPRQLADPAVARNIARLADHGWVFELQVFADQMADAAMLARACPDVSFVLQHAGMLEDRTEAGLDTWRDGMARLASCPNIASKLSGFGTFLHRNDPAFIAGQVGETVALFGSDRCLYGSNFPIEKLWTDYRTLFDAHQGATRSLTDRQRTDIFNDTAARLYRPE